MLTPASKYNAKPTVVDGIRFMSKAEARRYGELKLLERAGHITELVLQPRYDLHVDGVKIGEYRGDFLYISLPSYELITEDVKGYDLPLGRWKRKHLKAEYGIDVVVVKA